MAELTAETALAANCMHIVNNAFSHGDRRKLDLLVPQLAGAPIVVRLEYAEVSLHNTTATEAATTGKRLRIPFLAGVLRPKVLLVHEAGPGRNYLVWMEPLVRLLRDLGVGPGAVPAAPAPAASPAPAAQCPLRQAAAVLSALSARLGLEFELELEQREQLERELYITYLLLPALGGLCNKKAKAPVARWRTGRQGPELVPGEDGLLEQILRREPKKQVIPDDFQIPPAVTWNECTLPYGSPPSPPPAPGASLIPPLLLAEPTTETAVVSSPALWKSEQASVASSVPIAPDAVGDEPFTDTFERPAKAVPAPSHNAYPMVPTVVTPAEQSFPPSMTSGKLSWADEMDLVDESVHSFFLDTPPLEFKPFLAEPQLKPNTKGVSGDQLRTNLAHNHAASAKQGPPSKKGGNHRPRRSLNYALAAR